MIRKPDRRLTADMKKGLVAWTDQTHNIPLNQSLSQGKALTRLNSMKPGRSEEDAEEKFEASWRCFMRFKKGIHIHN